MESLLLDMELAFHIKPSKKADQLFLKLLFEVLPELFRVHKGKIDCILFYLRRNFKRIFLLNFYCYATLRRKKIKDIPFYILLFSLFIRKY